MTIGINSFLQRKLEYALCSAHYYKGLNLLCQKLLRMRDRNYRCPHVLLSRLNGCKCPHSSVVLLNYLRHYNILVVSLAQY